MPAPIVLNFTTSYTVYNVISGYLHLCLPYMLQNGFNYHHAQSDYVMMKKWISETEPDALPPYASHYVGRHLHIHHSYKILINTM